MRHARADDLEPLADLLTSLRALDGLTETKPGTFYRRSNAFLHFHVDPAGLFADLKLDGEFQRFRVSTQREQARLLTKARSALG
jgi:hypothetical protein